MKKYLLKFLCSMFLVLSITIPTYANSTDKEVELLHTTIKNIITSKEVSRVIGSARGRVLSSAGLGISNDKDGVLGVYAETLCHVPVNQIQMTIYLEVWDEKNQDWEYVNEYFYSWKSSDKPDIDLTDVSVSFDIAGLVKGKTYSLRAYHMAENFDNVSEMMLTQTGGILLE